MNGSEIEKFSENLRIIKAKENLTLRQIEKITGISFSLVAKHLKGTYKNPDIDKYAPLTEKYGYSLDWLKGKEYALNDVKKIPVFNIDVMRTTIKLKEIFKKKKPDGYYDFPEYTSGDMIVNYTGADMTPLIRDGGKIMVQFIEDIDTWQFENGQVYYVEYNNYLSSVARYLSIEDGLFVMKAYNKSIKNIILKREDIDDIHRVVWTSSML